jgi:hypothetical protein
MSCALIRHDIQIMESACAPGVLDGFCIATLPTPGSFETRVRSCFAGTVVLLRWITVRKDLMIQQCVHSEQEHVILSDCNSAPVSLQ